MTDRELELLAAIDADDAAAVEHLLAAEPGLAGARGEDGVSAILRALYRRREGALAALLLAAPALDLFEAAALGEAARVEELLAEHPAAAGARSPDGFTALHLAGFFDRGPVAEILLAKGADANAAAANPSRVAPLHSAATGRSSAVVGQLLAAGADPDARQHGGYVPLHSAAQNGDLPSIELLLSHGADRDAKADDGRSALDLATAAGRSEAAERLRR
jgi:ankyrin repeat protein